MEVSDLMFVEYTCMLDETKFGIWSDNNYFAYILTGKKLWRTIYNTYVVDAGDIIFVKKGANLTHQFFEDEFCAIFVFIPDDFIRQFMQRNSMLLNAPVTNITGQDAVLRIEPDELLQNYYLSIQAWLHLAQKPHPQLLAHKFEELLLSLFSGKKHPGLTDYFVWLCQNQQHQMAAIMQANFAYNLKLENYAQLCNMSLSTFKRTFKQQYQVTPAEWLKTQKLQLAAGKLITTGAGISQIAFECGFEDTSHFTRVFKQRYNQTPGRYRLQHTQMAESVS